MNQLKALFLFILLACSLNITAQRIKGSDTVLPVSQETAEIFMKDDPDRRVTVTGGGTGVGQKVFKYGIACWKKTCKVVVESESLV